MYNKFILIILIFMISFLHSVDISGIVTDKMTGEPLIGANVFISGTNIGNATNSEGYYQLTNLDKWDIGDSPNISIMFIGYKTLNFNFNFNQIENFTLDFKLEIDPIGIESVVIIGYGKQKKGNISTSISSLNSDNIKDQPVASMDMAIQGKISGVNVSSSSGQPGAAPKVQVRGATSITASSKPLYVIDGIPMISENNSILETGGYNFNSMSDINPSDIESIDVLKDASAAAIYGARGANGVIQITTKRGLKGSNKITFENYSGIQMPTYVIPMMNSVEFIELMNEAAENDGLPAGYFSTFGPEWNRIGDPNDPNLINTDWYSEVLRNDAPITNTSISASGGNELFNYYINGTSFNQAGIQKGTNFDRISFRVNTDAIVNDKLTIGSNVFSSRSNAQSTIGDNSYFGVMINALAADPTMPVTSEDGGYSNPFSYYSWWALENPVVAAEIYRRNTVTNRLNSSLFGSYQLIENLSLRSTISVDYSYLKDNMHYPSNTMGAIWAGTTGVGMYANSESLTWLTENMLTYNKQIGYNKLNTTLVYTTQKNEHNVASINAQNYSHDDFGAIGLAADITDASTMGTSWGMQSMIARVSLNHQNKYYISSSLRRDGSSRFGKENQYGIFPSFALAWRLTRESFIPDISLKPDLKFRFSYGHTGNQDGINDFASRALWSIAADYNGLSGINPERMGNADLAWENTTQTNFGFDLSILNGQFSWTLDIFDKLTTGLLLDSNVPGYTGFTTVTQNIGEVKNSGIEFSFHSTNIDNGKLRWESDFNISTIKNEIIKLEQDNQDIGTNILKEGYPLGAFYLIHWEGVDSETGNSSYTDQNGDGVINSGDMVAIKDKTPWPDYFGGFNNKVTYGDFDLNLFFQYSIGNYIFNHSRYAQEQVGWSFNYDGFFIPYGNNTQRVVEGRWRYPGDDTDIPRASLGYEFDEEGNVIDISEPNWQEDCDQWLEDASYLRLKTLEIGYNLPDSWLEKFGISNARLYFVGQNLLTFTKYLGVDPEVSSNGENPIRSGEDYGGLGQAKTYYFGIRFGV